ncbi:Uncharacterized protein DAT39_020952 [Clarias magur]|uniref:Uncharacterized protein n=1 Tax=Clarias magur TaxID=1594786 RepID=A0A8J4T948_CLAMG|nr:Uncharacterized protein DAT39_020952 [Clarias magur]
MSHNAVKSLCLRLGSKPRDVKCPSLQGGTSGVKQFSWLLLIPGVTAVCRGPIGLKQVSHRAATCRPAASITVSCSYSPSHSPLNQRGPGPHGTDSGEEV